MPTSTGSSELTATEPEQSSGFRPRLTNPHNLIRRSMEEPKKDQWGFTSHSRFQPVDARVSKQQKRLAMFVLDRLFKAIEAAEMQVEVLDQHPHRGTYAIAGYDKAQIYISEEQRQVEHVATPEELRRKAEYPRHKIPKWDSVPTGRLILHPGGVVDLSSQEALAKLIDKAMADIRQTLATQRERRESEQRRRNEEFRREQEKRHEQERVELLHKSADALHRYEILMRYIEEVRRFGKVPDNQRREGQTLEEWLQWAEWQARILHPLG